MSGNKRALLHLATGAGKTVCFTHIMRSTVLNGKRCGMLVRGRKLIQQASYRLFRENTTHGVRMAGHPNYSRTAPIQLCSVDTLISRKELRPHFDLIIIDEVHQANSDGYKEVLADYPNAYIIGVTATPYSTKGFRHVADFVVHPISIRELIAQGFLVDGRYFAPSNPDLDGVKVSRSTGDYMQDQLAAAMDKAKLTGDIVSHWLKLGEGRQTLVFAVSIEHSLHLRDQFLAAGVPAVHCDADSTDSERNDAIKRLVDGSIKVICNVGIFCTGVDIPSLSCIVMARPTQSYNLYIQQAGRGTRIHPSKRDFILLDHAGNIHRHGFITDEPEATLDADEEQPTNRRRIKTCEECFAIFLEPKCPLCGWSKVVTKGAGGGREIINVEGQLTEIKGPSLIERHQAQEYCEKQIEWALKQGHSLWRAFYNTKDNYGDLAAQQVFFSTCKRLGLNPRAHGTKTGGSVGAGGLTVSEDMGARDGGRLAGFPFK